MIKRIYVEADNLKPLIDWLKTKPDGSLKILVGGVEEKDAAKVMMAAIQKQGRSFGQWVLARIITKQLVVHATKEKPIDLESGIVVESDE